MRQLHFQEKQCQMKISENQLVSHSKIIWNPVN